MRYFLFLLAIVSLSCSSSKFNFDSAYKFSQYDYSSRNSAQDLKIAEPPTDYLASIRPSGYGLNDIPKLGQLERIQHLKQLFSTDVSTLTKERRREFRKEVKSELKNLRKLKKENKTLVKELKKDDATKRVNSWVYTGLVVGGAGLVLLILDVATIVGVIALLVGLGFIVYGLLVDGGVIG